MKTHDFHSEMHESDQIFNCSHETPYRLCFSHESVLDVSLCQDLLHSKSQLNAVYAILSFEFKKLEIFSINFDSSAKHRVFVCTQAGELIVIDAQAFTMTRYRVLFKIIDDGCVQSPVKIIQRHFDKFSLIPGRLNEFVFCLSVSPVLMYCSLPTVKSDDFIDGKPVIAVETHQSRITSLSTCLSTFILTGDETGNVKVMMTKLLDQFNPSKSHQLESQDSLQARYVDACKENNQINARSNNSVDSGRKHGIPQFLYSFLAQSEKQPIFSLQHVLEVVQPRPVTARSSVTSQLHRDEDKLPHQCHVFACGSIDRCVRLWSLWSSEEGITSIQLLLTLQTVSTSILALSCLATPSPHPSSASSSSSSTSLTLAAGTNTGTVYVWTLSSDRLHAALKTQVDRSASSSEALADDGSYLHSLLPAHEYPIVDIALSLVDATEEIIGLSRTNNARFGGRLRMICTDDRRTSCVHYEMDAETEGAGRRQPGFRQGFGGMAFYEYITLSDS